jgi:hypothetical protein
LIRGYRIGRSGKKALRSMGLNVLGGVSAYFIAQGFAFSVDYFFSAPQVMVTTIFITCYSGMVVVFVFRVWEDAKVLTEDLKIVIIANEHETLPTDSGSAQIKPTLFDQETYEAFQALICSLPREYTVIKLNRLYFLEKLGSFPIQKMQELVKDQIAFSQLLTCLKSDNYIRTDGFSFSIQPGMWETRRQEMKSNTQEFSRWKQVADDLTGASIN